MAKSTADIDSFPDLYESHILDYYVSKPIRRVTLPQVLTISTPVPTLMAATLSEQASSHDRHFDHTSILMKNILQRDPSGPRLVTLGFGLAFAKVYVDYWGGEMVAEYLMGYGTDVYGRGVYEMELSTHFYDIGAKFGRHLKEEHTF